LLPSSPFEAIDLRQLPIFTTWIQKSKPQHQPKRISSSSKLHVYTPPFLISLLS
jgi:hypothetical protein